MTETPEVPPDYSPAETDDGEARDTYDAVTGGQDPDATEDDEATEDDDATPAGPDEDEADEATE